MKKLSLLVSCAVLTCAMGIPSAFAGTNPKGKPFVSINNQIVEVKGSISSLQEQIDSLVARVETVEERVVADQDAISGLQSQNSALQALVNNSLTDIAAIEQQIFDLQQANADLNLMIADNAGDIELLQAAVDENKALITALESSLLMVQDGVIALGTSLQTQIDSNQKLITAIQNEIDLLNAGLAEKQNLVNGACPDGEAVREILPDGSVVCGEAGGGTSGQIETVFSYTGEVAPPGGSVNLSASCPDGYSVVSAGMTNARGWDVFKLHTSANSTTYNSALLIATNNNSFSTWITVVATCMRLVP